MRVIHAGIFQDHCLGGDLIFRAGFLANGVVHHEFDYRNVARDAGRHEMNRRLVDLAKGCDLLFIGKGESIDATALAAVRKGGTAVAIWYGDWRPQPEPWLVRNLRECDIFFMSSASDTLRQYFAAGRPGRAAFYLNPADPDLVDGFRDIERSVAPPLFTATFYEFGEERWQTYKHLCWRGDVEIVGSPSWCLPSRKLMQALVRLRPPACLRDEDYIAKIIRARLGIGVSAAQNIKYYSSDRLSHFLTFGKLYLAWRFPGCEAIFEDKVHLAYFDGLDDLDAKLAYYLADRKEAEAIGARGQAKMLTEYNAKNMIKMMLEIAATGSSKMFPWVEVIS